MSQFLGTHHSRRDAKGRISVPAPFRAALRGARSEDGLAKLIVRSSHKYPCVEAWPVEAFNELEAPLETFDQFSDDYDDMAVSIYADAYPVETDKEGRIVLPQDLVAHANITDAVAFMGAGRIFQLWEPEACKRRIADARERAKAQRLSLSRKAA